MKAAEWMRSYPLAHGVPVKPTQGSVLMLHSQPGCPFQHTHTHPFAQLCFSIFHSFYALLIVTITCCADILYNVKIRRKEGQCGVCVPRRLTLLWHILKCLSRISSRHEYRHICWFYEKILGNKKPWSCLPLYMNYGTMDVIICGFPFPSVP